MSALYDIASHRPKTSAVVPEDSVGLTATPFPVFADATALPTPSPITLDRMQWAYLNRPTPFGMAHRGGDQGGPENTLAAFTAAAALGYEYLETDVHLSSDGILVAFHDNDLSRLVGREAAIGELTWPEIQEIELPDGHHIPRLEDLLNAFPSAHFNIDPKSDQAVEPLVQTIRAYNIVDQVCIGSFSQSRIDKAISMLGPRLCTSPGPNGAFKVIAAAIFWPRWKSPNGCLQIPPTWNRLTLANPWLIRRIHRLGMQVHFWTINDPAEMKSLLDMGADAIITDNVNGLVDVLKERSPA